MLGGDSTQMPPNETTDDSNLLGPTEEHRTTILRSAYRSIVTLTCVVSAMNMGGHPTVRYPSYISPFDPTKQSTRSLALNAIAAILVRTHEIVAVAACDPPAPASTGTDGSSSAQNPLGCYQVIAVQDDLNFSSMHLPEGEHPISDSMAITNPDDSNQQLACPYVLASAGQSRWMSLDGADGGWNVLDFMFDDSLANHIATVTEYLRAYNGALTDDARSNLFHLCSKYLVASCWFKMRRRIIHWSSQVYIFELGKLEEAKIRAAFESNHGVVGSTERQDSALGKLLVGVYEDGLIGRIMNAHPDEAARNSMLPHLVAAFKEVSRTKERTPYNECTCFEFHQLLVATLVGYGKASKELEKAYRAAASARSKSGNEDKAAKKRAMLAQCATDFWEFAHLLWRIAYSRMLHEHLAVLEAQTELHLPRSNSFLISRARRFTGFCSDVDEEGADEEGADAEVEDESLSLLNGFAQGEIAEVFKKWIRLQVTHWTALQILSSFISNAKPVVRDVSICLLVVQHPGTSRNDIDGWESTVQSLPTTAFNAGAAIKCIRDTLDKTDRQLLPVRSRSIFWAFQQPGDVISFNGNLHSEAVLIWLMEYADTLPLSDDLREVLHSLNKSMIAVSKLSCRVCWEFADIIKKDTTNFALRGNHRTLSPVELPSYLPYGVLEEMVTRFKTTLIDEITTLVEKKENQHFRNLSDQSDGGLSVASDESGIHSVDGRFRDVRIVAHPSMPTPTASSSALSPSPPSH